MALTALAAALRVIAAPQVSGVVARQLEPWGLVEISYDVSEDSPSGRIELVNEDTGGRVRLRQFTRQPVWTAGTHTAVWDGRAEMPGLKADHAAFEVTLSPRSEPLYCVIDLSGGTNAAAFRVDYVYEEPADGWSDEYKTTKLALRAVEPGSFKMLGAYDVELTQPFYIGVFEVTQRQYELVTGETPSSYGGDGGEKKPVERVSYDMIRGPKLGSQWPSNTVVDASSFLGRLRAKTGVGFDLPTEAQWEYACRAGTTTTYNYGNAASPTNMWYGGSSGPHEVGLLPPNAWGLYDMHGNVWEWCLDWRGNAIDMTDPKGAVTGRFRMVRGGGWGNTAYACTSAHEDFNVPTDVFGDYGFRLALTGDR